MKLQTIFYKIGEFIKLCYPITLIYPIIVVLTIAFISKSELFFDINVVLVCVLAAILTSIANIINQIADHKIDKINSLDTPVVQGTLNKKEIMLFTGILMLVSFIIAISLGFIPTIITLISIIISFAYSVEPIRLKKRTFLSHISIAFCYGILAPLLTYYVFSANPLIDWAIIGIIFTITLGLTMQKDYRDVIGDSWGKANTYLIKFGRGNGALIHLVIIIISFILLISFIRVGYLNTSNYIVILAAIPIIASYAFAVSTTNKKNMQWAYPLMTISASIAIILICFANL